MKRMPAPRSKDLWSEARSSRLFWSIVSVPSVLVIAWLGKLKPGMPWWQWGLGILAVVQITIAIFRIRYKWQKAKRMAEDPLPTVTPPGPGIG